LSRVRENTDAHTQRFLFTRAEKGTGGKQTGNEDPPKWAKKGVMEIRRFLNVSSMTDFNVKVGVGLAPP